jgi:hypothetical protein
MPRSGRLLRTLMVAVRRPLVALLKVSVTV